MQTSNREEIGAFADIVAQRSNESSGAMNYKTEVAGNPAGEKSRSEKKLMALVTETVFKMRDAYESTVDQRVLP